MGHIILKNNFSEKELSCRCGCGVNNITPDTLRRLNISRFLSDFPYILNRAGSCKKHNKAVGGVEDSDHIYWTGFDIKYSNSSQAFQIIKNSIYAGFTRIIKYKTFIHIGLPRENKKNNIFI